MATATQPLREEHKELIPHIEALRDAADAVGDVSVDALRAKIDESCDFLSFHLIPHAQAEERALYPVVGRILGAAEATRTMSREHTEVMSLTHQLVALRKQIDERAPSAAESRDLRRILYGLYALVRVHFTNEEEVYLPLLDARLSPDETRQMFEEMEHAAAEAKANAHGNHH